MFRELRGSGGGVLLVRAGHPAGQLDPGVEPQLVEHVGDVGRHGPLRDEEPGGDLMGGQTVGDSTRYLQLSPSQRRPFLRNDDLWTAHWSLPPRYVGDRLPTVHRPASLERGLEVGASLGGERRKRFHNDGQTMPVVQPVFANRAFYGLCLRPFTLTPLPPGL